jgi:hypothetical protein
MWRLMDCPTCEAPASPTEPLRLDKAIADGETLDAFRKRFADIVQKHGWHGWTGEETPAGRAWRTRVIYQTNLATSYAAGRLAQLKDAGFRYWIYRHTPCEHPRLHHLAWDRMTLPADHPFWKTHYPPNGWGCRCRVVGANGPASARLLGGNPDYNRPPAGWDDIDPKTGEPVGIDKGWGYMPGGTVADDVARAVALKTVDWPYRTAKAYMEDVPVRLRDALAVAIRSQPETGEAVRRYAERALGMRGGQPIKGAHIEPYQALGLLTSEESETVADLTNTDSVRLEIYDWTIDAFTVRKVANDNGADATGVRVEDYALLPRLTAEADRIEYGGTSDVGLPTVRVVKRIGGLEYRAVFEVRARHRMLALKAFWIRGSNHVDRT